MATAIATIDSRAIPPTELNAGPIAGSAVIPCLNEEQTLALCIEKAFRGIAALGVKGEVVVADNGSTDRSVEIALALGARVEPTATKNNKTTKQARKTTTHRAVIIM